jgi:hypothetical protein
VADGLMVSAAKAKELKQEAVHLPSWDVNFRQIWDLELLLNGAFSPLKGYLGRADYDGVCENMRLADGALWPMPITLDVTSDFAGTLKSGARVALRHPEGMVLAVLTVSDIYTPDKDAEAERAAAAVTFDLARGDADHFRRRDGVGMAGRGLVGQRIVAKLGHFWPVRVEAGCARPYLKRIARPRNAAARPGFPCSHPPIRQSSLSRRAASTKPTAPKARVTLCMR